MQELALKHARRPSQKLAFVPFQHPTLVVDVPTGDGWSHEIKHDGYRTQLLIRGSQGWAQTRNGLDWSDSYRTILSAAKELDCDSAVIDGEVVVQDAQGRSDFGALRAAIGRDPGKLVFYAFDLMGLDGVDLRQKPLRERRAQLFDLIGDHDPRFPIQFSQSVEDGQALYEAACGMELEGVVSKKLDSKYFGKRSLSWLKVKCYAETELTVIGAEHERGKPAFALLMDDAGEYRGSAFVTLEGRMRDRFWSEIDRLERKSPAIKGVEKKPARRWVEPSLRVNVQHLKGGDKLRHATIREIINGERQRSGRRHRRPEVLQSDHPERDEGARESSHGRGHGP